MSNGDADVDGRFGDGSEKVIGALIEVHKWLGPGLLESAYQACVCHELARRGFRIDVQRPVSILYKDLAIERAFKLDVVVGERLVLEIKSVERILPIHEAQTLTYLRLTGLPTALLVNFNVRVLREGIRRLGLRPSQHESIP